MKIQMIGFPPILRDNDTIYLQQLQGILESVDELCHLEATNKLSGMGFRVAPSSAIYAQHILKALKDFHYRLALRIEFSKSIRTTSTIEYQINLDGLN